MSSQDKKAYFALDLTGDKLVKFALVYSLEDAIARLSESDAEKTKGEVVLKKSIDNENEKEKQFYEFTSLMFKALNFAKSNYSMVRSSFDIGNVVIKEFAKREIKFSAEKEGAVVYSDNDRFVYELSSIGYNVIAKKLRDFSFLKSGYEAMRPSAFLGMVASFDSIVTDVVKVLIKNRNNIIGGSEPKVSMNDLLSASSIDEIINKVIEDEMYQFSRGSHSEQVEYITKKFNIEIKSRWDKWPDFIEIFERRNLIAHGEKLYNMRYNSICTSAGSCKSMGKSGHAVSLSRKYLINSIDTLSEFIILLIFMIWIKNYKESKDNAFSVVNQIAYSLLLNKQYTIADRILKYCLSLEKINFSEVTRKMMIVNRANALKKIGDISASNSLIDGVDWSASSENFQICVAAIRGNVQDVVSKMELVIKSELLTISDFLEWPVFDDIRESEPFKLEFARLFNRPMISVVASDEVATGE